MDDETRRIDQRMITYLASSDIDGFLQIAIKDLKPRIVGDLIRNMRMSPEDAEDCVFDVFKKVYARSKDGNVPSLASPVEYLWRASKNQALTLIKKRKSESDAKAKLEYLSGNGLTGFRHRVQPLSQQDSRVDVDAGPPSDSIVQTDRSVLVDVRAAMILAESLIDDAETETEPDRLSEVVALAMSRLTPALADVIDYLLKNGFDDKAADAARELGIKTAPTFRKRKERAYAQLRVEIVRAMGELGVERRRVIEEIVDEIPEEFPSTDEAD